MRCWSPRSACAAMQAEGERIDRPRPVRHGSPVLRPRRVYWLLPGLARSDCAALAAAARVTALTAGHRRPCGCQLRGAWGSRSTCQLPGSESWPMHASPASVLAARLTQWLRRNRRAMSPSSALVRRRPFPGRGAMVMACLPSGARAPTVAPPPAPVRVTAARPSSPAAQAQAQRCVASRCGACGAAAKARVQPMSAYRHDGGADWLAGVRRSRGQSARNPNSQINNADADDAADRIARLEREVRGKRRGERARAATTTVVPGGRARARPGAGSPWMR